MTVVDWQIGSNHLQLIPARTLHERGCCPPVAWIEWSECQLRHNADTANGEHVQRLVPTRLGGLSQFGLGLLSPERR